MCFDMKRRQNKEKVKIERRNIPVLLLQSTSPLSNTKLRKIQENRSSSEILAPILALARQVRGVTIIQCQHTLKISTADPKKCGRTRMAVSDRQRSEYQVWWKVVEAGKFMSGDKNGSAYPKNWKTSAGNVCGWRYSSISLKL